MLLVMRDLDHKFRTLTLVSVLHAFTHLYQVALLPLYFPIQTSFKLQNVGSSTFLVTLLMVAYFVPSYPMGVLADRVSRKKLLGVVLAINGLGFISLAVAPNYPAPPVIAAGQAKSSSEKLFTRPLAAVLFIAAAFAFSLRDFTGSSMASLGSLFLQNAHGFSVEQTGVALSGIFLASIISNPLFGHLSDGGRKRWACLVHAVAAALVALLPHLPGASGRWFFLAFMAYGFFFMASYPIVEAGVMQAVPASVRGRAFGLWITLGGLTG